MRFIRIVTTALCFMLASALAWAQAIDLNTAPASDLATLDGVNEELARNIVREREENGPYSSVDDLSRVPGMTPSIIAKLRSRVVAGGAATTPGGKQNHEAEVRRVLKKFANEPSIQQVQSAAIDYARANPGLIDSWRIRSRTRGLGPRVTMEGQYDAERNYRWLNTTPGGGFLPPSPSTTQPRTDELKNKPGVQAQLRWDLDRLIFDTEEPKVNREAVRLSKHRDQVVDEVTRRYFERRRLQVEMEINPPQDVGDRIRKEIRLQELTADIDGLTGGWFSEELKKKGAR
ncbi:MAG: helix-hairpin-helix domain-containing protein [Myxococcota bacterium]